MKLRGPDLKASFEVFIDKCIAPNGFESRKLFDMAVEGNRYSPEAQQAIYRWIGRWHGRNVSEEMFGSVEWSINHVIDLLIYVMGTDEGWWWFYRDEDLDDADVRA